jgi:hypothetical protein
VIIEHLIPARLVVAKALDEAAGLDVNGMLHLLAMHGAAAVVTIEDDKRLSAAGVAAKMPDDRDGDVWARPRYAGLDPRLFAPIPTTSVIT